MEAPLDQAQISCSGEAAGLADLGLQGSEEQESCVLHVPNTFTSPQDSSEEGEFSSFDDEDPYQEDESLLLDELRKKNQPQLEV